MNLKQALLRNMRTCRSDAKGEVQVETPRGESTDAEHRGGPWCSSDEAFVMKVERRDLCCLVLLGRPTAKVGGVY